MYVGYEPLSICSLKTLYKKTDEDWNFFLIQKTEMVRVGLS